MFLAFSCKWQGMAIKGFTEHFFTAISGCRFGDCQVSPGSEYITLCYSHVEPDRQRTWNSCGKINESIWIDHNSHPFARLFPTSVGSPKLLISPRNTRSQRLAHECGIARLHRNVRRVFREGAKGFLPWRRTSGVGDDGGLWTMALLRIKCNHGLLIASAQPTKLSVMHHIWHAYVYRWFLWQLLGVKNACMTGNQVLAFWAV